MKRRLTVALAVLAAGAVLFPCCNKQNNDVKNDVAVEIILNKTKLTIEKGETFLLTAKLSPESATESAIVWSSENPDVATVSDEGEVAGVKAGETVITAALSDGNVKATCRVTVQEPASVAVTGVKINYDGEELNLFTGTSFELSATVEPADATDKKLTWTVDKTDFATVDADGKVSTDKMEGTATVTVSAGGKSASLKVNVYKAGLSVPSMSILKGEELAFKDYFQTGSIPLSDYTFSSDKPEVASIDGDLKIVGKSDGTAVISAKYSGTAIAKFETEPAVRFEVTVTDSFVAAVNDVLTISGQGVVLTTTIESGTVRVGDKVRILQPDEAKGNYLVTVKGIELFKKSVESATAGDKPGILIGDQLSKDKLMYGAVLMSENTTHIAAAQKIVGTVTVTKHTPVQLNEEDQFYSSYGANLTGTFTGLNNNDMLLSGQSYENIWVTIKEGYRFICRVGQEIIVRNGGKEVAKMVIVGSLPYPGKDVEYTDVSQ